MTVSADIGRPRRQFTADEYHRMAESGVLGEDDRVELLEGEIVEMTPIGSEHAGYTNRLNGLLQERVGSECIVSVQNPVSLGTFSEPEPDLALLRDREDDYISDLPGSEDVLLIIEVADTSLEDDRRAKVPLYARHGIPAVWIVNLQDDVVEVYEEPDRETEAYGRRRVTEGEDVLRLDGPPDLAIMVREIFSSE
ncbi:MAG: Uma2 family endonuclease [Bradymonadaceae bacterium]